MPKKSKRAAQSSNARNESEEERKAASQWNDYYNCFSSLKNWDHSSHDPPHKILVLSAIKVLIGDRLAMGMARSISLHDIDQRVADDLFLTLDQVIKIRKEWEDSLTASDTRNVASGETRRAASGNSKKAATDASDSGSTGANNKTGTVPEEISNTAQDDTGKMAAATISQKRPAELQTQLAVESPRKRLCKGWTGKQYRKAIQVSIDDQMRDSCDRYSETVIPTRIPLSSHFGNFSGNSELCVRCETTASCDDASNAAASLLRFSIRS